jgi:hypothetical protein
MKTKLVIPLLGLLFITAFARPVQASSLCSYQGIATTLNIRQQMSYSNEKFIGISNIDQVRNLSQLQGLTCLQYLDFYKSDLKGDLSNLKNLTNLVVFNMNNNPGLYGDVCALKKAKNLRTLRLAFNPQITGDISCLKDLSLEVFAVTGTQISGNLSSLSHMTNLKELYLGGTRVEGDIASLAKLTDFTELVVSDSQEKRPKIYGDLSSLKNLKKLWRVALYNTNTTNCTQFTKDHPSITEGGCSQLSSPPARGPRDPRSPAPQALPKNILNPILIAVALLSIGLILALILKKQKK